MSFDTVDSFGEKETWANNVLTQPWPIFYVKVTWFFQSKKEVSWKSLDTLPTPPFINI